MSLLGWAIGLSIADHLLGEVDEREERQKRESEGLRDRARSSERCIAELEREIRELKRGGRYS